MPALSEFLGIVITMYFNDHNPPHFHVRYDEYRALIAINNFSILEGACTAYAELAVFAASI
jgi:hypothetical protein